MFQPLTDAISHNFKNYANLRGRTGQRDYWYFILAATAVALACWLPSIYAPTPLRAVLIWLPVLIFLPPILTATIRRFRDADRPQATYNLLSRAILANIAHLALVVGLVVGSLPLAELIAPNTGDSTWGGLGTLFVWLVILLPLALIIGALTFVPVVLLYRRALIATPVTTSHEAEAVPSVIPDLAPATTAAVPMGKVASGNAPTTVDGTVPTQPVTTNTNPLAVTAIALIILSQFAADPFNILHSVLSVTGIILGITAIRQIRRVGGRGLTPAYIAIVLGSIMTVLYVIIAVATFALPH